MMFMEWIKKGRIYEPDKSKWWSRKYALYPTPVYNAENHSIRVYFGTTDENMFGRISFIDLDADNPSIIKYDPGSFILDLGNPGSFDDCGVSPASVITIRGKRHIYYSGFCRSFQTPYHIFSGLAVEAENGMLVRISDVPVLDRTKNEYFDKGGPSVLYENGIYKAWYVSGIRWETISSELYTNKKMPVHIIRYGESADGITWKTFPGYCFDFEEADEFGFGRPWVVKENGIYKMWYSIRGRSKPYRPGYAVSEDGINWVRKDGEMQLPVSETGWDSEMVCYAAVITINDKTFMFYNGNNHGETGFGYAELSANK